MHVWMLLFQTDNGTDLCITSLCSLGGKYLKHSVIGLLVSSERCGRRSAAHCTSQSPAHGCVLVHCIQRGASVNQQESRS
jgi:hypothetical protein